MLSFAREIERLQPILGERVTRILLARERREVFSVQPEVRVASWLGAVLIATAAGIVVKDHLDRIGPLALALALGVAAAACYAWVWWHRARATVIDDYVLLLGALLLSADVAFVEAQYRFLGDVWHRHFALLAVLHAAAAYRFLSRTLLALAIVALAAWMGIERRGFVFASPDSIEIALRALLCAAVLLIWRTADRRLRRATTFSGIFEHFAANLALAAGATLMAADDTRVTGCLLTLAAAAATMTWGFRTRRETFVLYAFVYAVVAFDVLLFAVIRFGDAAGALVIMTTMVAAIAALIVIHRRFQELER